VGIVCSDTWSSQLISNLYYAIPLGWADENR
jgi:hypothetical protein